MNHSVRVLAPLAIACSLALLSGCGPSKSELAREIAALKEQVEKGTGESKSLNDQIGSLKSELDAARKQLADARSQAAATDKQLAEVKGVADATQKALAEARGETAAERQVSGEARSELEKVRVVIVQRERQVEERAAEVKTLQAQLDVAKVAERSAAAERDAMAAEASGLRQQLAAADTRLKETGSNLQDEQKRASDLTDRLAALIKEQSSLKQISESQRAELAAIAAALADAQAKVARLTGARGIYTVQDGDSLSSIALYFYRNAHRWPGIAKANSHLINHPDRIFPAMVLIIPK